MAERCSLLVDPRRWSSAWYAALVQGPIPPWTISELLATKRYAAASPWWQSRFDAMERARHHATLELRQRLAAELAAMRRERRAHWDRSRAIVSQDAAAMLGCLMRDGSVRGLGERETAKLRLCFLDGKPLPERRQRWCSDACVRAWTEQHEWSSASYAAVKRDDRTCVRCGSTSSPEVNHKDPLVGRGYHQGCHHHLDGLETLCHSCHVVETTRQRRERLGAA